MTEEKREFPGFGELMKMVFEDIGAKPEHIIVPNVLLKEGDKLELYVCPQRIGEIYGGEDAARESLGQNETLYRVDIRRVE